MEKAEGRKVKNRKQNNKHRTIWAKPGIFFKETRMAVSRPLEG
jgi:hypothetical protein